MTLIRSFTKKLIGGKLETTYGVDPGSWASTDWIRASRIDVAIQRDTEARGLINPFFGASEELVAARRSNITVVCEMAGSGTAGTAPAWGRYLRACGFAETVFAGNRVEYTPVTDTPESMTFYFHIDGVRYVARGGRGSAKLMLMPFKIPRIEFTFMGMDTAVAAQNFPSVDFTAWKDPLVLTDAASGELRVGGTYSAGGVSGGTAHPMADLEIDAGQKISHLKLIGGEAIHMGDRETTGKMTIGITAADEITWRNEINANTRRSLGLTWGTVAGQKGGVFGASVQRIDPQPVNLENRLMLGMDLRFIPVAGNDELRIWAA